MVKKTIKTLEIDPNENKVNSGNSVNDLRVDSPEDEGKLNPPISTPPIPEPISEVELLKQQIKDLQTLVMATADKGRLFNYENSKSTKNPIKIKLSRYGNGLIIGWRTVKDQIIRHPTTGTIIGEQQEYELLVLGDDGKTTKSSVNGYPAFSNARYNVREEAEVISKTEDYSGNVIYNVKLGNGQVINLDSRFAN